MHRDMGEVDNHRAVIDSPIRVSESERNNIDGKIHPTNFPTDPSSLVGGVVSVDGTIDRMDVSEADRYYDDDDYEEVSQYQMIGI